MAVNRAWLRAAQALKKAVQPSLATTAGLRLEYSKASEAAKPSKEGVQKAAAPAVAMEETAVAALHPAATPYAEVSAGRAVDRWLLR